MSNLFELTEAELSVDVNNVKHFTQENVDILDSLRSKAAHPRIYGSKAPKGIKYINTQLIDVKDIDSDNEGFNQGARVSANEALDSIRSDITSNGYSLTELPICVMMLGDGKYIILEGRTRFYILRALGVKNIIADVFEQTTSANALRFAVAQNSQKKPHGPASFPDVNKAILELIRMGEIDAKAPNFTDLVSEEIMRITNKLEPQEINRIIHNANDVVQGERTVFSYPKGEGVKQWLQANGYTDNREIMYHPVSTYDVKTMLAGIRQAKLFPNIKEIRLVVHGSVLNAKDPAGQWIKNCKGFKNSFNAMMKDISKEFFGGAPIRMNQVRLYGAIPQVKALEDKYPMDELYLFN
jgi:hypothetical protein